MQPCAIKECPRAAAVRGYCKNHYIRERARGRIPLLRRPTDLERFRATFQVDPGTGCHLWTGSIDRSGYGLFWAGGKTVRATRWIYQQEVGPIPDDHQLDHFWCDRRSCVNSKHVRPVTPRENLLRGDAIQARNLAKTHCPYGHPYDEANTQYRPNGDRRCRACRRAEARQRRLRKQLE
jgi:hypothetical protein